MILLGKPPSIEWEQCKKELKKDFLNQLKNYDKDNMNQNIIRRTKGVIKEFLAQDFKDITVLKQKASESIYGLAKWVTAIIAYYEALQEVIPRQKKLKETQEQYEQSLASYEIKQEEVNKIKQMIEALEEDYDFTVKEIERLDDEKKICQKRLENADKLISLLSSEGERWKETVGILT